MSLSLMASLLLAGLWWQLTCCEVYVPFLLWFEGSGGWKKKKKQSKEFLSDGMTLVTDMSSAWKVPLIWRSRVSLESKCCLLKGLTKHKFAVFFWGAGSLISSPVDVNGWAGGSDYITYERTGLSDLWGSPESRKESWLFRWSHHWWKGLFFCLVLLFSITYIGAMWQLTGKRWRFYLNQ